MIVKVQGGGKGSYANTGSSEGVVNYLQHEDIQRIEQGQQVEHFFNQHEDRIKPKEVSSRIDNNRKGLKAQEAKFYVITVAPSAKELNSMGATKQEQAAAMKDYIRSEVIPRYAEGFNKGLKPDDIVYYAKIHHERNDKDGENLHAHIIVSHKTKDNGKAISPNTNHTGKKNTGVVKGGFDRKEWFQGCEQGFDRMFSHSREMKETFAYRNAIKNGKPSEIKQIVKQQSKKDMEQSRGMTVKQTTELQKGIEKASLKETSTGTYLNIRYDNGTGSSHRLDKSETEALQQGKTDINSLANQHSQQHLKRVEREQSNGMKL